MNFTKKLMLASAALLLPAVAVVGLSGVASAARLNVTGTGTVTCKKITGTITFNPPLSNGGTATSETATVKATATKCKTSKGSNVKKVKKIISNTGITSSSNTCAGLSTASPPSLAETYSPASISPSTISGGTLAFNTAPTLNFTITGESVSGSFPTTGTTSIKAVTNETSTAFGTACGGAGVTSLKITSGNVTGG